MQNYSNLEDMYPSLYYRLAPYIQNAAHNMDDSNLDNKELDSVVENIIDNSGIDTIDVYGADEDEAMEVINPGFRRRPMPRRRFQRPFFRDFVRTLLIAELLGRRRHRGHMPYNYYNY